MKTKLFLFSLLLLTTWSFTSKAQSGALDLTFNTAAAAGTPTGSQIYATAIQSDGRILVGGYFTNYGGSPINGIVRLNANGTRDLSFNTIGTGISGFYNRGVQAIVIQGDGKILIGGDFPTYNGVPSSGIARLLANGTIDPTFITGSGINSRVSAIAIQNDGKILIGGYFTQYDGIATKLGLARLEPNGALDLAFNSGTGPDYGIETISIQPSDGNIIIGGQFTSYGGNARLYIARLFPTGVLDPSFNSPFTAYFGVRSSVIQPDGKIIIGGASTQDELSFPFPSNSIRRLNANGSFDLFFINPTAISPVFGSSAPIALQTDGKIVVGGSFLDINGVYRSKVARLNGNGTLDVSFNSGTGTGVDTGGHIRSISIQSDGKIIIAGRFASYNGTSRIHIARLGTGGCILNTVTTNSSTTICINRVLPTITHTTTGATGIGVATGLPNGITASWVAGTLTIIGTPTNSGTFNYDIPLTGGCGSVSATGTIIVNPIVTGAKPAFLVLDNVTNSTISVSWAPVVGAIDYQIRYRKVLVPAGPWNTPPLYSINPLLSHTIAGLQTGALYQIRIRARFNLCKFSWSGWRGMSSNVLLPRSSPTDSNVLLRNNANVFQVDGANQNNLKLNDFEVYPNPASSTLFVTFNSPENGNYAMYSVDGRLVKMINTESGANMQIDVSNLNRGIYLIRNLKNTSLVKKVVLE